MATNAGAAARGDVSAYSKNVAGSPAARPLTREPPCCHRPTLPDGDAFAAAFVHGLASGWPAATIADFANRAGAAVAAVRGAIPAR